MTKRLHHPPRTRALELRTQAYAAYRAGDHTHARRHFERALTLFQQAFGEEHPETLTTLSDLGATCSALGDDEAAHRAHAAALRGRRAILGDTHPETAASLHNLGVVCRAMAEWQEAETLHRQAAAVWRDTLGDHHKLVGRALSGASAAALAQGNAGSALQAAREALTVYRTGQPADAAAIATALDDLSRAQTGAGDHDGACQSLAEAISLTRFHDGKAVARLHLNAGLTERRLGRLDSAAQHFTEALQADPVLTAARHYLAATLTRLRRHHEARTQQDLALREQSLFVQAGPPGARAVLILAIADDGNVPLDHLLPENTFTRLWWFIAHDADARRRVLPPHDAVFNAIGDSDQSASADAAVAAFAAASTRPILNAPERVASTRRDRLPATLAGIPDLVTPPIIRLIDHPDAASVVAAAEASNLALPVLLRPAGSHGGAGVVRVDDWAELRRETMAESAIWYLSPLLDCRSPDGMFRKYRLIFIDGTIYPYHLAISPQWLVHYVTADMPAQPWKLQEEARFLNDPRDAIGARAYAALQLLGKRLDLAYCGVDCTVLADGSVLVFEANPTMLVHPEREGTPLAFKNSAITTIIEEMDRLICRSGE